jgi:diacylglycerol kinase family enzyme
MLDLSNDVAIVLNGNAKSVTKDVIDTIGRVVDSSRLFVSTRLEQADEIAQELVRRRFGTVLTGGGDGTFTVMVTKVTQCAKALGLPSPRFGLIKLGTGNAMAWMVGASRVDPIALPAAIEKLRNVEAYREIRLVDVEGHLTPFSGIGADAQVLADYNATKNLLKNTPLKPVSTGLFGYALSAVTRSLPGYLVRDMADVIVTNLTDGALRVRRGGRIDDVPIPAESILYRGKARFAGAATIPYYGFGFKMFPFSLERPDKMHLRVSSISSLSFVTNLNAIWTGTYESESEITDFLVDRVRIECHPETDFQIGGDPFGLRRVVELAVSPDPIRVVDHALLPD